MVRIARYEGVAPAVVDIEKGRSLVNDGPGKEAQTQAQGLRGSLFLSAALCEDLEPCCSDSVTLQCLHTFAKYARTDGGCCVSLLFLSVSAPVCVSLCMCAPPLRTWHRPTLQGAVRPPHPPCYQRAAPALSQGTLCYALLLPPTLASSQACVDCL